MMMDNDEEEWLDEKDDDNIITFYHMYLEINEKYKELFERYLFETTQLQLAVMDRDNQIILLKGDLEFIIQKNLKSIKKN
jgi:hypothetical protein